MKNAAFWRRLRYAASGLASALRTEASFRTQVLIAAAASIVLAILRPPM